MVAGSVGISTVILLVSSLGFSTWTLLSPSFGVPALTSGAAGAVVSNLTVLEVLLVAVGSFVFVTVALMSLPSRAVF